MSEIKEDVVRELHTQACKNFLRRKVDIRDKDECWQADLVDMIEHAQVNSGWAIGLKSKTGKEVSAAMEKIFKQGRVCKNLHVDQGTEFYNAIFEKMLKKYNVHSYSTYTHSKASIIERFNKTIKNKIWFQFSLQGSLDKNG
ncbi:uncharacterized protein LOC122854645 [Aphidius gifuensis]|uniref:uncharacterized protein LOC122854645 n=1 Tax=Aphidius gifuensis TaxID=684658 RepID=UPI001CDCB54C|nr:uncharacterized protein LOC122854645 [Aphidius gifuensis]